MSFDLKLENGNLSVGSDGKLNLVFNEEKLIQDVLKSIFTPTGTHQLHPWFGSPLQSRTVGQVDDPGFTDQLVASGVIYALRNLQMLQQMQEQDGQFLTPKEQIKSIQNVSVLRDISDRRKLSVLISILTRSGDTVDEGFVINI